MIQPELYKKTVDILYQAYFNDTLQHGYCSACAVGNLVAASLNYGVIVGEHRFYTDPISKTDTIYAKWAEVFMTGSYKQSIHVLNYTNEAKKQIDSTGYTWQNLAKIESAFETAPRGSTDEDWMFNGLVAVLEVLKEIHQVDESEATEAAKPFHNHYQTLTA